MNEPTDQIITYWYDSDGTTFYESADSEISNLELDRLFDQREERVVEEIQPLPFSREENEHLFQVCVPSCVVDTVEENTSEEEADNLKSSISNELDPDSPVNLDSDPILEQKVRTEESLKLIQHDLPSLERETSSEQIFRVGGEIPPPKGAPIVTIEIRYKNHKALYAACVDSGCERTCCTQECMLLMFGDNWLDYLCPCKRPLKLRSASGHPLKIYGILDATITLGTYTVEHPIVVIHGTTTDFLLGNDYLCDRII
jgi:hypothetical protein